MYLHYLKKREFDGMFHGLQMEMGSHSECKCTVSVLCITFSQQLCFSLPRMPFLHLIASFQLCYLLPLTLTI